MAIIKAPEEWRDIPDYEGYYQASDHGRIRSKRGIRALTPNQAGYLRVNLSKDGIARSYTVHVLIAATFHGPRPDGLVACHNRQPKTDNRPSNLRYDTQSANLFDKARHGTCHNASKTECPQGHEYTEDNIYFGRYKSGKTVRNCRLCALDRIKRKKIGA